MEKTTVEELKFELIGLQELYNKLEFEYQRLKEEYERYKSDSIRWSVEDFYMRAEDRDITISSLQAALALEDMIKHHDCTIGITWETVDYYIDKHIS